ncbi:MAG: peptidase M48, partial [Sulfurifustis sp.]
MDLVYGKEKALFTISIVLSLMFWLVLVVGTLGMVLIWALMFFLMYLFAHSAFISYLKGTAVRVTAQQFPDLYQRIAACAHKLGMQEVPDAYLLHGNGVFNALATRFLGRHFIVLYSDVV